MNPSQNSNRKSQSYNSNIKSDNVKVRAYKFSLEVIRFVNVLPQKRGYWSIADQLVRSATSIGANLIEAQAASSRRDFVKFYEIALKSANETKYWIALIRDSSESLKDESAVLLDEVTEISKMIGSSVLTLKGKRKF